MATLGKSRRQQDREASRLSGTYNRGRSYDFDSMPRKSTSLSSIQPDQVEKDEGALRQNGRTSPYVSQTRTPESPPELRARPAAGRRSQGSEDESKTLLGLNTSV